MYDGPIIIQGDLTIFLDTSHDCFEKCRDEISVFAELLKSPEYMHTYRITKISLWNAAALGYNADQILDTLSKYSRHPIPENVIHEINFNIARYGKLIFLKIADYLKRTCANENCSQKENELLFKEKLADFNRQVSGMIDELFLMNSIDKYIIMEIMGNVEFSGYVFKRLDEFNLLIFSKYRGELKRALLKIGYPVRDRIGYDEGSSLDVSIKEVTSAGKDFKLRDYQMKAVSEFYREGQSDGGSGVIVLPCGAGKTCVGIGVMEKARCETLILTTNTVAVRQWINELLDKTWLDSDMVGEYTGDKKQIRPVTVSTYQTIMWHRGNDDHYPHFVVLTDRNWGMIIYDEVHLLPAPIFRVTAQIQAKRRLGLTATLVREDNMEGDVFSLIGPKKYELPWKNLERSGYIAKANCYEIRVKMPDSVKYDYAVAKQSQKYKISATNPDKIEVISKIISMYKNEPVIIIAQYLDQLSLLARVFNAPLITGSMKNKDREILYNQFKLGQIPVLLVSKVANFAIDLPDASCAIQISGTFGSRQEEAQRLGRVLRPKKDGREAHFYSIVSYDSIELEYSHHRQLFLTEQGYKYTIIDGKQFIQQKLLPAYDVTAMHSALTISEDQCNKQIIMAS